MGKLDDPKYTFPAIARRMHQYAMMDPQEMPPRPVIEEAIFPPEGHYVSSNLRDDSHFREFFRNLFMFTYTHPELWGGIDVVGFTKENHAGTNELTYLFYEVKGINVPDRPRRERNTQFPISVHQIDGPYGMRENLRRLRHRPEFIGENGSQAIRKHAYGGIVWMLCHHPEKDRAEREYDIYVTMPIVAVGLNGSNIKYKDKRHAERASVRDQVLEKMLEEGRLIDITHRMNEPRVRRFAVSPHVHLPQISTPQYRAMIERQENEYYSALAGHADDLRNEGWSGDELPFTQSIDDVVDSEVPF